MQTFDSKTMSLLTNMLSRFAMASFPRIKHLLILLLQSPSTVILELKKRKSVTVSTVSPSISHEVMGLDAMILVFWMLSFKPDFSRSSFTFIKRLFSSFSLSAIKGFCYSVICISEFIDISPNNLDSSLCFFQPSVSHDVLCIEVNKQGDNTQPCTPFLIWNQSLVPCPVLTVASWPTYRFLRRKLKWYGIFHSLLWST